MSAKCRYGDTDKKNVELISCTMDPQGVTCPEPRKRGPGINVRGKILRGRRSPMTLNDKYTYLSIL